MRNSRIGGDSLDLLLDAVCNMFGGIIFLALLVVVSASALPERRARTATVPAAPHLTRHDAESAALRVEALRRRLAALRSVAEQTVRTASEKLPRSRSPEEDGLAADGLELEEKCRILTQKLSRRREALAAAARTARERADFLKRSPAARREILERLRRENASLRREIAALPPRPWIFAPPEKTALAPWRLVLRGGKLYNAGDNAATRRGGTPDIAAEYLRRGSREYWRLRPRENGGAAALEFDWESWSRDVPRERYFVELLCDPGDVAAAAPVREALRRFGYYQSFRVRAPDALALTAREGGDYEASR